MCSVRELGEIEDGGDCNLNLWRVWTDRDCVHTVHHPHHPSKIDVYQGHMATTTGKDAEPNDQCVPEESPMAVLCCGDGDIVYGPPRPAGGSSVGTTPAVGSSYWDDTLSPGGGTGSQGSDASQGNGGGFTLFVMLIIACIACGCFLVRRTNRALQ